MQHQHAVVATVLDRLDDGITHCQPVGLLHVGAVDQRVEFEQRPAQLRRVAELGQVFTHARIEATRRRQALRSLQHADGATGIKDEKVHDWTHGSIP